MKPRTKKMLSLLLIFTTLVVVVVIGLQDSNLSGTIRAVRNLGWQYIAYCTLTRCPSASS